MPATKGLRTSTEGGGRPRSHVGDSPDVMAARMPVVDLVTTDIDGYRATAAGVQLDMIRNGPDAKTSRMRAVQSDLGVTLSEARPGCKTVSYTHLGADRICMTYVLDAPAGTRWCGELDLEAGMCVVHQPDAEHTAANVPGTRFVFGILDTEVIARQTELLKMPLAPWRSGEVDIVAGRSLAVAPILAHFASDRITSVPGRLLDDLVSAVVFSLYDPDWGPRLPVTRAIDSRKVVGDCLAFAASTGREPSIAEMCLVARTSGRRLRQAFQDACGVSPKRFFRHWALCRAHERLLDAASGDITVTRVATDLGLSHLGRFSAEYLQLHGESPSQTLRRPPAERSFL